MRLVLQRGLDLGRRRVALRLVEELDPVTIGVLEAVRGAVPEVAVEPLPADAAGFQCRDSPPQRLGAVGAIGEVPDARLRRRRELERGPLIVTEAAQVDRIPCLTRDLHTEDLA